MTRACWIIQASQANAEGAARCRTRRGCGERRDVRTSTLPSVFLRGLRFQPRTLRSSFPAFTLIELLVVISIISILVGLLLPALASSRENARQLKCLTNLKGLGVGINLYLEDAKGMFPSVLIQGGQGDPTLLDALADYVDAPAPRKDADGVHFIVTDPYLCPSDNGDHENDQFETVWSVNGTSYDYLPGVFMVAAEGFLFDKDRAQFAVTRAYQADRAWPFLYDAKDGWHKNRNKSLGPQQNALYYPDWRADWIKALSSKELEDFFNDVKKFGGMP